MARYDIGVLGLGPSGALFAWLAASKGYRVIGYDLQKTYRKPCGDAIIVNDKYEDILHKSNSIHGAVRNHVIEISGGGSFEVKHNSPAWYIVDKGSLVGFLREKAAVENAELRYEFKRPSDLRDIQLIVDARGPYAFSNNTNYFITSYRAFLKGGEWPDDTALLRFEVESSGIIWIFPSFMDRVVNVGGGIKGASFEETKRYVMSFVKGKLGTDVSVVGEAAAPIAVYAPVKPVDDYGIRLGETGGLINSAGGEGIRMALLSALRASEAIASGLEEIRERYLRRVKGLVREALLSRRLLYAVESVSPDVGKELLSGLPEVFWRKFLKGKLSYKLLLESFIIRPRIGLLGIRALLSSRS